MIHKFHLFLQNCHFLEDVKQLGITINAKARVLLVEIEKLRTSGISVEHSNKVWSDRVIIYVAIFFIITMLCTNQYYNIAIVLRMKMMILACLLLSPLLGTIPFKKKRDDSTMSPSIAYRIRSLPFCLWCYIVVSRSN